MVDLFSAYYKSAHLIPLIMILRGQTWKMNRSYAPIQVSCWWNRFAGSFDIAVSLSHRADLLSMVASLYRLLRSNTHPRPAEPTGSSVEKCEIKEKQPSHHIYPFGEGETRSRRPGRWSAQAGKNGNHPSLKKWEST